MFSTHWNSFIRLEGQRVERIVSHTTVNIEKVVPHESLPLYSITDLGDHVSYTKLFQPKERVRKDMEQSRSGKKTSV